RTGCGWSLALVVSAWTFISHTQNLPLSFWPVLVGLGCFLAAGGGIPGLQKSLAGLPSTSTCEPFLIVVATYSASRGRNTQTRCHSVFDAHSSSVFFQERCVATDSTVNFEPLLFA